MGFHAREEKVLVASDHRCDGPGRNVARLRTWLGAGTIHLHDLDLIWANHGLRHYDLQDAICFHVENGFLKLIENSKNSTFELTDTGFAELQSGLDDVLKLQEFVKEQRPGGIVSQWKMTNHGGWERRTEFH